jgi:FtsP/CotA-like multicopper oxidase with cupredoxin domain
MLDPASIAQFIDPLPVPAVWSTSELAARGLTMAPGAHRFSSSLGETPTWGYGGAAYLGPTIQAQKGSPVSFTARNRLGPHPLAIDLGLHGPTVEDIDRPRVSLHLHGGYTEPASDGYPEDTFRPGEDHVYDYAEDQQAGTIWYHDHALGLTRLNVYAGLAGAQLIRDSDTEVGLPDGEFELPIVIQDKRFLVDTLAGTNPLAYPAPWAPEFFGNVAVINGVAWPNAAVARGWYRLRLLNGSSSRIYHLALSPGRPFVQIGTDTGLTAKPRVLDRLVLAPGERADVLVDFGRYAAGTAVRMLNLPLPAHVVSPEDVEIPELMQFTVGSARGLGGSPARPHHGFVALDPAGAAVRRTVLLTEIMDHESGEPLMALLNARPWTTDEIERPRVDALEVWEIVNLTADTHPIHLHLVQFQPWNRQAIDVERYLLDVFGTEELGEEHIGGGRMPFPSADGYLSGRSRDPEPYERGWKDTVQAHPGMVTRIVVPFGRGAGAGIPFGQTAGPFVGRYVWHCHILDHEDNEMMLPYEVTA